METSIKDTLLAVGAPLVLSVTTAIAGVPDRVQWRQEIGDTVSSPAIGEDGTLYIGAADGNVYALDPTDGSIQWRRATGEAVGSSPAIGSHGTVYVGSEDHRVYALDPGDGTVLWQRSTGGRVLSSPSIGVDGTVYIGSSDNNVYALDPADGSVRWQFETGASAPSTPAIGADGTVYIGSLDNSFYALDPDDGRVLWRHETRGSIVARPAIGADGTIYVGSRDGKLYALAPTDGAVEWTQESELGDLVSPAIATDGTLFVGTEDRRQGSNSSVGGIVALDPTDGSLIWQQDLGGRVTATPAIGDDGAIYVGTWSATFNAIDPSTGNVEWQIDMGDPLSVIVASSAAISSGGTVYFGSTDNHVYAVETESTGLATSAWPMLGHDIRHTGRSTKTPVATPGALSGAWIDPTRAGEGYMVDISAEAIFVAWFTYDDAGKPIWLTGQAAMPENGVRFDEPIRLDVRRWREGTFADPTTREASAIGDATVEWSSCTRGALTFDLEPPFGAGSFDMRRVVAGGIQGVECD